MKFTGGTHRVLPDHRVGDEQHFARLQFLLQIGQLVHQLVVDVQAAGGVDQHHIARRKLRFLDRAAHNFKRLIGAGRGPDGNSDGLSPPARAARAPPGDKRRWKPQLAGGHAA